MDWSYIAGFFDGEGNFHISFSGRALCIMCRIYGNSLEVFDEMIRFMGFGKVYFRSKGDKVPELTIYKKQDVKAFLENILPYLILKKDHAKFILSSYDFENGRNNLDFDRAGFYRFISRANVKKLRSINKDAQIIKRKEYLSRLTEKRKGRQWNSDKNAKDFRGEN